MGLGCQGAPEAVAERGAATTGAEKILPAPRSTGPLSLEAAIAGRRSVRELSPDALPDELVAQLAWAAQGITGAEGTRRAAPSAGALYPLNLYLLDASGTWRYEPAKNRLHRLQAGDRRATLARAALHQPQVGAAAVDLVLTGVVSRTRAKYGNRAERYVFLEAGHAAQNVLLQATALGLSAVPVGAFDDDEVRRMLGVTRAETPVYIICVGR